MRDIIEKILVGDILMSNAFLVEGKTKIIEKTNDQNIIRIVTKDFLTGGDAAKKEEIKDIGIQKTKQTSNVFSMLANACLLYTSPSPRDGRISRMPSSA